MTKTSSLMFRAAALTVAAGLALTACADDDQQQTQPGSDTDADANANGADTDSLERQDAPETTDEETALATTLEEEFDVDNTLTLEEQWPDITSMSAALTATEEPDLCQEAGASQYGLLVNAQPANVRADIADDAVIDDNATDETVTAFYANDEATAERLQEVHENTDTACIAEDDAQVEHDTSQDQLNGHEVDIHTWQIIVSEQLTGRMVDVVGDEIYVRYSAAYPPQIMVEDLDDDLADFHEEATERAANVFEAAAAQ